MRLRFSDLYGSVINYVIIIKYIFILFIFYISIIILIIIFSYYFIKPF